MQPKCRRWTCRRTHSSIDSPGTPLQPLEHQLKRWSRPSPSFHFYPALLNSRINVRFLNRERESRLGGLAQNLILRWDEGALWKSKRWNRSEVRWGGRLWWRRTRRSWSRWKDNGAGSSAAIPRRLLRRSSLPPQTLWPSPWRQLHSDQTRIIRQHISSICNSTTTLLPFCFLIDKIGNTIHLATNNNNKYSW